MADHQKALHAPVDKLKLDHAARMSLARSQKNKSDLDNHNKSADTTAMQNENPQTDTSAEITTILARIDVLEEILTEQQHLCEKADSRTTKNLREQRHLIKDRSREYRRSVRNLEAKVTANKDVLDARLSSQSALLKELMKRLDALEDMAADTKDSIKQLGDNEVKLAESHNEFLDRANGVDEVVALQRERIEELERDREMWKRRFGDLEEENLRLKERDEKVSKRLAALEKLVGGAESGAAEKELQESLGVGPLAVARFATGNYRLIPGSL